MINRFLSKYKEPIYAVMRMVVAFLFLLHGIQKLNMFMNGTLPMDNTLILLACFIETVGAFLILIGWFTDWAAFIASGEMAVAYFKAHAPNALSPLENGGEVVVLFCFIFLFIAAYGSGIWSVDNSLRKKTIEIPG